VPPVPKASTSLRLTPGKLWMMVCPRKIVQANMKVAEISKNLRAGRKSFINLLQRLALVFAG
jgi:hypothetical protein